MRPSILGAKGLDSQSKVLTSRIADLSINPRNARIHSPQQVREIARSIKRFGFNNPVLVDRRNQLIAGHGRVEAAKLLGYKAVPTLRLDHMTEEEKRAYVIADNKLAEKAAWATEILAIEFQGLIDLGFDVELTGFDVPEIEMILDAADPAKVNAPDEHVPGLAPDNVITKPNDLWILGKHRLFCGDARHRDSFEKLLGGESASLVFVDPPYNVKIRGHVSGKGRIKHREFAQASGEKTPSQFAKFLEDSLGLLAEHSTDGAIHSVCSDWRHLDEMVAAGRRVYRELKNLVVWNKTNAGMGSLFRSQHELIFVWKHGRGKHINNVELGQHGRNRSNVWTYGGMNAFGADRLGELAMHPTVKPVALVADAIRDCSRRGDLVLDSFGGSGTTLIACERTQRKARLIELAPLYCDQTIRRWQKLTGQQAVHAVTGRSFDHGAVL
ncbi:MAG: site-specific DNA-methyltransferase [Xanthobacteraceae bacterium]